MIKDTKNISVGNGYLFIATSEAGVPTGEAILAALRGGGIEKLSNYAGVLKGDAELTVTREPLDFEAGIPQELQKQVVIRESATFKCSLAELALADIKKQLGGGGSYTSTSGGTVSTTLDVTMTGTTAQYLGHANVSNVVVSSKDATPVIYTTPAQYTLDATLGTVTRVDGGGIDDEEVVSVAYDYTSEGSEVYMLGGQASIATYFLRFAHQKADESLLLVDVFKAGVSGSLALPFKETDWWTRDIEFKAQADTGRPKGQHLFKIYQEIEIA